MTRFYSVLVSDATVVSALHILSAPIQVELKWSDSPNYKTVLSCHEVLFILSMFRGEWKLIGAACCIGKLVSKNFNIAFLKKLPLTLGNSEFTVNSFYWNYCLLKKLCLCKLFTPELSKILFLKDTFPWIFFSMLGEAQMKFHLPPSFGCGRNLKYLKPWPNKIKTRCWARVTLGDMNRFPGGTETYGLWRPQYDWKHTWNLTRGTFFCQKVMFCKYNNYNCNNIDLLCI